MNKGPWYNIYICSRLHGSLFEDLITHERTDRYDLICSLVAHDKIQPYYEDDESSIVDRLIPKNETIESLEALGATINVIDIWLKLFEENYDAICVAYITAMKYRLKQTRLTMIKSLTLKKSSETYDINWWWMVYRKKC